MPVRRRKPSAPATDAAPVSPLSILLPYQRRWVGDDSRFKIGLASRQIGKSFMTAGETVTDALQRKTMWVCMSAGERQALEWMRKAHEWAEAYRVAIADALEVREGPEALLKSAEVEFPNGSRIVAIPANADTARGYSANIVLDEFAFHERPDAIWRSVFPSVTNPLKGALRLRVVSTPNGLGNKFADLWRMSEAGEGGWVGHRITIHDAKAQGLPVDIDGLRAGLSDPEGWAQEYECQFLDQAAVLLSYELIGGCESVEAVESAAPEYWTTADRRPLYLGIDFGRKRNMTVCWAAERIGDVLQTREVLCLQGMSTVDQVDILRPRIKAARRCALDYTGPGVGLGDYLVREFGEWAPKQDRAGRVELCTFGTELKVDIFSKLRMAFERRGVRIPISRAIREDLHSMHRVVTPSGNLTYRAPLTDDGHADRCTALALALRAAGTGGGPAVADRVRLRRREGRIV